MLFRNASPHPLRIGLWGAFAFVVALVMPVFAGHASEAQSALDLNGHPLDPFRSAPGKVVVLIFIRTDCPVSNRYAPAIQQMSAHFSQQAVFWLVYPDKSESAEKIRRHLNDYRYRLGALRDPSHVLVKKSEAQITPEAAVFAPDGRLVYHGRIDNWYEDFGRSRPAPTTHELKDAVQAAWTGKPASLPTAAAVGCYIPGLQ